MCCVSAWLPVCLFCWKGLPSVCVCYRVCVCVCTPTQDAQRLLYLLQRFYLKEPALVETFNKRPQEFDFNRLLIECP